MTIQRVSILVGFMYGALVCAIPVAIPSANAASPSNSAITEEARDALLQMGKTLLADQFSVQVRTIRAYQDKNGELLHIFHILKAVVRRPDRLLVDVNGDDGARKFVYDGKTLVLYRAEKKRYASIPVPNDLEGMLQVATSRLGVDFPLADFLTKAPNKAFLTGGTAGKEVNTVIIDGVPCRHLFFSKPPGIEEELWVEENDSRCRVG